jgi:secreted trypsin-like serine protease
MAKWRNLLAATATALTVATMGTLVNASPAAAAAPGDGVVSPAVVGGTRATQGEFPFMVRRTASAGRAPTPASPRRSAWST